MTNLNMNFLSELSFHYDLIHKNFGMIDADEPFDLFYDGTITKLRSESGGYPETIGIFFLNVLNIGNARMFNAHDSLLDSFKDRACLLEDAGFGLGALIDDANIDFQHKDKIIFLKSVIVHPKYRKMGVFEELIKSIYMSFNSPNSLFIVAGKPLQSIDGELDFMSELIWDVWEHDHSLYKEKTAINVGNYFKLDSLPANDEMNEYKIFAKLQGMNMKKYGDTPFFYYDNNNQFFGFLNSYVKRIKVLT